LLRARRCCAPGVAARPALLRARPPHTPAALWPSYVNASTSTRPPTSKSIRKP
jgi:hypothetical protein